MARNFSYALNSGKNLKGTYGGWSISLRIIWIETMTPICTHFRPHPIYLGVLSFLRLSPGVMTLWSWISLPLSQHISGRSEISRYIVGSLYLGYHYSFLPPFHSADLSSEVTTLIHPMKNSFSPPSSSSGPAPTRASYSLSMSALHLSPGVCFTV